MMQTPKAYDLLVELGTALRPPVNGGGVVEFSSDGLFAAVNLASRPLPSSHSDGVPIPPGAAYFELQGSPAAVVSQESAVYVQGEDALLAAMQRALDRARNGHGASAARETVSVER